MRKVIRGLVCSLAVLTVLAGGVALPAQSLSQGAMRLTSFSSAITIQSNVNIRPSPDKSQPQLVEMPAGSTPRYICYADGQNIDGTTTWFYIEWQGVTGYYSSVADDVPLAKQSDIEGNYGIPRCGTGADINQRPADDDTELEVVPEEKIVRIVRPRRGGSLGAQ